MATVLVGCGDDANSSIGDGSSSSEGSTGGPPPAVPTTSTTSGPDPDSGETTPPDTSATSAASSSEAGDETGPVSECMRADLGSFIVVESDGSSSDFRAALVPNVLGPGADEFGIQFRTPGGAPGVVDLGDGDQTNYATCTTCLLAQVDGGDLYFQYEGTVEIDPDSYSLHGYVKGTLEGVILREAVIDPTTLDSNIVGGGLCIELANVSFEAGVPPECSCDGLGCGDDGCGGSCGECEDSLTCVEGECVCVPDCALSNECGDDGCGGVCGTCGPDEECQGTVCVEPGCGPTETGSCVEAAPPDWTGPVAVYEGVAPTPACPEPFSNELFIGHGSLDCGDASCSPCSCDGTPAGGFCSASPSVRLYEEDDCSGDYYNFGAATSACYDVLANVTGGSARAFVDNASGTSCGEPSGGEPSIDTPTWDSDVVVCGSPVEPLGCDDAETCAEPPPPPLGADICIYAEGVQECPVASAFTNRRVFYTDFEDTRACTESCSCSPSGKTCSNIVDLLAFDQYCGDDGQQLPADGACHVGPFSVTGFESIVGSPIDGTGSCSPFGSTTIEGACEPLEPGAATVCCL